MSNEQIRIQFSQVEGYAVIRPFMPRKLRKQVKAILYDNIDTEVSNEGGSRMKRSISSEAIEKANDIALIGMITELNVNGESKDVSVEVLDDLPDADVQKVIDQINEVTADGEKEKKS